ncbi:SCO7613 C-terminal domain-containing membrane protein [Agromyces ramosus]|uniref:Membrane protein DUF2157 n=1 Tax=Agromyces ramosus TaxID=33879 RepID=A0ABU0R392_9MICO|nr:hypothetical protein [Agromyces ramosus]MDQ0892543.1 hypothetical protein [Agromyces ramosus]
MTDRPLGAARDLQRWPADPDQLVDTTRCPACFAPLDSTRCRECGLELGVPAAAELLALSTRVHAELIARRSLITRMRVEQATAERAAAVAAVPPVAIAPATSAPTVATVAAVPPAASAPPSPLPPAASVGEAAPRSSRSSVQVLLLTLGVVLISITAIVFLFVAYLVATLEVRSVIIAVASVLVLGVAWLLRARRLPGTAEGVASVAIVLLLLDVWIVRANGLFGTDSVDAAGYTGAALLVVSIALLGVRAVSGIRVAGFAAAGLAPVGVFLLAFQAAPEGEFATGVWLGCLAASLLGTLAVLTPRTVERVIVLGAGFAAGIVALTAAVWALPESDWNQLWSFLAVGAAWLLALIALRARGGNLSVGWTRIAALALGASLALAPAVSIFSELDLEEQALWLAPAAAGAVVSVLAAVARLVATASRDAFRAAAAAVVVTLVAAVPGLVVGVATVAARLFASAPPWQLGADSPVVSLVAEAELAAVLVPFVLATGALVVTALARRFRTFAALPIGAALAGVLVSGAVAPGVALSAAVLLALGAVALALAAMLRPLAVRGLLTTLLIVGASGGALAWWVGYSSADVWPWAVVLVIATIIAGRVFGRQVWTAPAAPAAGATHLALAATLAATAVFSIVPWLESTGVVLAAPWASPWMWLATIGSALLIVAAFARVGTPADRLATVVPIFAASAIALIGVALETDAPLRWLPAVIFVVAGLLWLRTGTLPSMQASFGAATPLALALGAGLAADELFGPEFVGAGVAGASLLAAALAHVVLPADARAARLGWSIAVGLAAFAALLLGATGPNFTDQLWLVLLLLTPIPIVMAALDGDPIAGRQPSRHLAWLSLGLAVATVWAWLAGDGVDNVEAYTLPLAVALAVTGGLITWRRGTGDARASGRTALFGVAAAVAVLPSVASSGDSELRTIVLSSIGIVVAIAAGFLPESARGVPVRLLGVAAGWVAVSGAALVRGSAVATGTEDGVLVIEFWPLVALVAGIAIAMTWARSASRPAWLGEALLAASVALATIPTVLAIVAGDQPTLRAAVLFPLLAAVHVAASATTARPVGGPMLGWTSLGALVLGGLAALVSGDVDPFDIVTVSVGGALIGAGAFRMRRSPELGSWPALGPGLAVLLLPALLADFTDPEVWRNVALGIAAVTAVVVGAMHRLQAPLLLGGAVLLVHAIVQLWPWITELYEAVWWWLWLGIAGVLLVVLAATYERQLRLARGTVRSIAALR